MTTPAKISSRRTTLKQEISLSNPHCHFLILRLDAWTVVPGGAFRSHGAVLWLVRWINWLLISSNKNPPFLLRSRFLPMWPKFRKLLQNRHQPPNPWISYLYLSKLSLTSGISLLARRDSHFLKPIFLKLITGLYMTSLPLRPWPCLMLLLLSKGPSAAAIAQDPCVQWWKNLHYV